MPLQDELEGEMLGQTKRLITLHPFSPRFGDLMYYITSDQIEQQFNSMSDLKNDVAGGKTTIQSTISTFISSKRAAPDTPSVLFVLEEHRNVPADRIGWLRWMLHHKTPHGDEGDESVVDRHRYDVAKTRHQPPSVLGY